MIDDGQSAAIVSPVKGPAVVARVIEPVQLRWNATSSESVVRGRAIDVRLRHLTGRYARAPEGVRHLRSTWTKVGAIFQQHIFAVDARITTQIITSAKCKDEEYGDAHGQQTKEGTNDDAGNGTTGESTTLGLVNWEVATCIGRSRRGRGDSLRNHAIARSRGLQ